MARPEDPGAYKGTQPLLPLTTACGKQSLVLVNGRVSHSETTGNMWGKKNPPNWRLALPAIYEKETSFFVKKKKKCHEEELTGGDFLGTSRT